MWLAKSNPYLLSPSGTRIDLQVHGHIPYLQVGHPSLRAMDANLTLPRPVYPSRFKSAAARTAEEEDDSDTSDEEEDTWTLVNGSKKGPCSILKSSPAPTSGAKYFAPSSETSSADRRAGNSSAGSEESQASEERDGAESERSWTIGSSSYCEDAAPAEESLEASDPNTRTTPRNPMRELNRSSQIP